MIEIRAGTDDAELSGSVSDLAAIRVAIVRLINSSERQFTQVAQADVKPDPYDRCLTEITLVRSDGPTRVSIAGTSLLVTGADENLAGFATWFSAKPGEHGHYEYFEGNNYIAADSVPLVVAARY